MKLSLRIVFIFFVVLKASSGFTAANPITDLITDHQAESSRPIYKSIVDKSTEEQNVAKYYKLSDLFANPKPNEIILIRGKLVQHLSNNDLFVFQDGNAVANITIDPHLWANAGEKAYVLDKNLQFLVKVIISSTTHSVTLQTIKVFHKISDTDNYILNNNDKEIAEQLDSQEDKKLVARTISDTSDASKSAPVEKKVEAEKATTKTTETAETTEEEDFDSVEETQNKATKSIYGVPATEEAKKAEENQAKVEEESKKVAPVEEPKPAEPIALPEDKPAEDKAKDSASTENDNSAQEQQEELKEEEPEPEIYNKVPEEEQLQLKGMSSEEKGVLSPEEIQKLEQYDKNPPVQQRRKSLFSFSDDK